MAAAQTSSIAGVVRDASGGVLPGVTVEVASPALIEKVRTAITNDEGRYSIVSLRPGIYTVTFTLPGFGIVKQEGIELTSDFTANVNADMKVGTLEETITVTGESPIVDTQAITQRHVMTRDVLDVLPTGRNIQAVGIMIPGTALALGGGGALSRDVGGSGNLQQSPLQYRGSGDTVQTIEGLRLNNLCAQGAVQRRLLERRQLRGTELRHRRRLGGDGPGRHARQHGAARWRQPVPRSVVRQLRRRVVGVGQLRLAGLRERRAQPCTRSNLTGSTTFNPNNTLTNVDEIQKIWDVNPSIGGPIMRDKLWFHYTFRHWGVEKTKADSYFDANPSPFVYDADTTQPGHRRRPHRQQRRARVVGGNRQGQVLGLSRRPAKVPRPLGHRRQRSAGGGGRSGHADELRQRHQVDAHAHQPAAARSGLRHLQPGIHRAVSAERHRARGQGVGPRKPSATRASTT